MLNRYIKNTSTLNTSDIESLHTKKVCIIGCGGLGGYNIEIMSRIGIHNLTIVDGDSFDETNLNRQLISNEDNIGISKADEAEKRIKLINSNINITKHKKFMDSTNVEEIISDHNIVIDCLDNIKSRLILESACDKLDIPLVHGSIAGFYGQVTTIFKGDKSLSKIFKNTNSDRGVEKKIGNLPFIASCVASIQSSETIKVLLNKGDTLNNKLLLIDLLSNSFDEIDLV